MQKEITVVLYGCHLTNNEWSPDVDFGAIDGFVEKLSTDLSTLGITVSYREELDTLLEVKGYGDMLNLIRLDRKSTRLNSSHVALSRMPSSA